MASTMLSPFQPTIASAWRSSAVGSSQSRSPVPIFRRCASPIFWHIGFPNRPIRCGGFSLKRRPSGNPTAEFEAQEFLALCSRGCGPCWDCRRLWNSRGRLRRACNCQTFEILQARVVLVAMADEDVSDLVRHIFLLCIRSSIAPAVGFGTVPVAGKRVPAIIRVWLLSAPFECLVDPVLYGIGRFLGAPIVYG